MKKLLSLLSVLTISGTAIPTTVAVNSYQKKENENIKFNYSQTNKLKDLNRKKRQPIYINITKHIPDYIYINLPRGIAVNNNPPDLNEVKEEIKRSIFRRSNISIPTSAIQLSYFSRMSAKVEINFNQDNYHCYTGNKFLIFI